jgi:hypothetical protein
MTSFTIDTGVQTARPPIDFVPDWFRDAYSVEPSAERVIHDYGYHLIGALRNPAKVETCRKHTIMHWGFLRNLAEIHPSVFDEFMCAYAERVLGD